MVVHVNLLHTEGFSLEGSVPAKVVEYLQREFGSSNIVIESDEELMDPFDTDWFRESMDRQTPGSNLRFYRKQKGMTQKKLAEELGTTKQAVCGMEHDTRPISKKTAKVLAALFGTSPARFI